MWLKFDSALSPVIIDHEYEQNPKRKVQFTTREILQDIAYAHKKKESIRPNWRENPFSFTVEIGRNDRGRRCKLVLLSSSSNIRTETSPLMQWIQ